MLVGSSIERSLRRRRSAGLLPMAQQGCLRHNVAGVASWLWRTHLEVSVACSLHRRCSFTQTRTTGYAHVHFAGPQGCNRMAAYIRLPVKRTLAALAILRRLHVLRLALRPTISSIQALLCERASHHSAAASTSWPAVREVWTRSFTAILYADQSASQIAEQHNCVTPPAGP